MSDPGQTQIAIIGMAGRFGGAPDLASYWNVIRDGVSTVRTITTEELLAAGEPPQRIADPGYVPRHAAMADAEWFDAELFGISPLDAALTDPQHRVFLEACWQAMKPAGYPPTATDAVVGVYAGCKEPRYRFVVEAHRERLAGIDDYRIGIATGVDHLCMRVSHRLGLSGPSVTVMTTCSTSLVAVHLACQGLLAGDCDMALAGGVMVRMPLRGSMTREGSVISPDGVCRPFDAAANGTIGGDGVGVVVLKRLADAVADGDYIHAVIRGSAVNNDAGDRVGYHAPSTNGQATLIRSAHLAAEVDPRTIDHVQAHGTATTVGDPIEVAALTRAFAQGGRTAPDAPDGDPRTRCVISAVKGNIGHTDTAAGVAGLLATVLAIQNRTLPPIANLVKPNPDIGFERTPFTVLTQAQPWPEREHPRRAGVSSFGMGGTNAHVVLEEAPPLPSGEAEPYRLLVLSANTPAALEAATANLAVHLRHHPELSLDDVAYTLQVGRTPLPYRRFAVVTDHADAIEVLTGRAPGRLVTGDGPCPQRRDHPVPDLPVTSPEQLAELGRAWLSGAAVPWQRLHEGKGRRRVPLPTYPFQRKRHILEPIPWQPATAAPPPVTAQVETAPAQDTAPATAAGTGPDRSSTTLDTVRLLFGEVLGVSEAGPDDNFFLLGGDSLVAAQLAARFEEVFGVNIPLDIVFESPTARELAASIDALLAGRSSTDGVRP